MRGQHPLQVSESAVGHPELLGVLFDGPHRVVVEAVGLLRLHGQGDVQHVRFCAARPSLSGVWLNAVGSGADAVADDLARRGLPVAHTPLVPLADLPAVLRAADLHLITLKDAFVGYALPSKVHGCIASGRPILFVGSAKSDVHRYCTEAMAPDRYRRVDVGNVDGVEAALDELLAGPGGPSTIAGPPVGEGGGR